MFNLKLIAFNTAKVVEGVSSPGELAGIINKAFARGEVDPLVEQIRLAGFPLPQAGIEEMIAAGKEELLSSLGLTDPADIFRAILGEENKRKAVLFSGENKMQRAWILGEFGGEDDTRSLSFLGSGYDRGGAEGVVQTAVMKILFRKEGVVAARREVKDGPVPGRRFAAAWILGEEGEKKDIRLLRRRIRTERGGYQKHSRHVCPALGKAIANITLRGDGIEAVRALLKDRSEYVKQGAASVLIEREGEEDLDRLMRSFMASSGSSVNSLVVPLLALSYRIKGIDSVRKIVGYRNEYFKLAAVRMLARVGSRKDIALLQKAELEPRGREYDWQRAQDGAREKRQAIKQILEREGLEVAIELLDEEQIGFWNIVDAFYGDWDLDLSSMIKKMFGGKIGRKETKYLKLLKKIADGNPRHMSDSDRNDHWTFCRAYEESLALVKAKRDGLDPILDDLALQSGGGHSYALERKAAAKVLGEKGSLEEEHPEDLRDYIKARPCYEDGEKPIGGAAIAKIVYREQGLEGVRGLLSDELSAVKLGAAKIIEKEGDVSDIDALVQGFAGERDEGTRKTLASAILALCIRFNRLPMILEVFDRVEAPELIQAFAKEYTHIEPGSYMRVKT
ncbi:MAG: hypothetical protein HQ596_08650 [Candidatus Saganbacteria bacterium]|nr:hypothetical protein [Candidatus Saganbacteria bacterium]